MDYSRLNQEEKQKLEEKNGKLIEEMNKAALDLSNMGGQKFLHT